MISTARAPSFGRILTAMITPFDRNGEVDLAEAARLARWLVEQGNEGLVICGSTGEGTALSDQEKLALFRATKEAVGTTAAIVAGSGGPNTQASVSLTQAAQAAGVDAILATVPAYCKPTQDGMLTHFGAIAEATTLPVVVYNIPGRTAANMLPATLLELARRYSNVVGVKESSADFNQFSAILRERRAGFTFWSGDDYLLMPSLAIGADGIISVAGHLCAREIKEMIAAHLSGDAARAAQIHLELTPLFAALFSTSNPIPVKWAMRDLGFAVGACRSPLGEMPADSIARLRPLLEGYRARVPTPVG